MSKSKKPIRQRKDEQTNELNSFNIDKIIPPKYQTASSLLILLVLFLIFFSPMYFGNKTFESGDIITSKSMVPYVENDKENYTLWNPYIFGGMPAHAIAVGYKWFNLIYVGITSLRSVYTTFFDVEYAMWTFYLVLLAFTGFFFMKYKTGNNLVSIFTAAALSFSTGLIVFLFIGHVTKLTAICMFPLIFLMLLKFQNKIKILDVAILVVTLQLFVQGWHVQIIFYTLLSVAIYFIYYFVRFIIKKEKANNIQLVKSAGVFVASALIAILIQSDNLTQVYNYTEYSTRGTKSILEIQGQSTQSQSQFYQYATDWSFSPGEVMTFIIPSYYGFGNSTYNGPLTNNQDYTVNTYFGQMNFVDVAMYMGVIVFFLALFAMFTSWKDPFVQFLTILSIFSLLVSFGRNFSPVFDLMFYYFPFFDKFRVPVMILVPLQLSFPILAGIGLKKIISLKQEKDLRAEMMIKYAAYIFTILFFISLVLNSAIREWFTERIINSGKNPQYLGQLSGYASDMFISDIYFAFAFCAITFWAGFAYINNRISKDLLALSIILLTIIDLWRIDNRGAKYIANQDINNVFRKPDYISIIENQKDTAPYRLLNMKQNGSYGSLNHNSNYHAHFLKQDIFGYSGIKPRAYQDYMDIFRNTPVNLTFWRMANVKYIIMDKPANVPGLAFIDSTSQSVVYLNTQALPRAYFVNEVETKPSIEILNAVKNDQFDPKQIAYLEKGQVDVNVPDSSAYANVTMYDDEHIIIDSKATGNNFLVLSDTYYPKGWKALIDGKETEIYRTNHAFRGIIVPDGQHKIEFIYAPVSFYVSQYVGLILSSLVVIAIIIGIYFEFRKKKQVEPELVKV